MASFMRSQSEVWHRGRHPSPETLRCQPQRQGLGGRKIGRMTNQDHELAITCSRAGPEEVDIARAPVS
jgi:hypothetical protein